MSGATLEIHIDDAQLRNGLAALQAKLSDLTPVFQDLGEALLNSTRERFRSQTDPDGSPWARLSPGYQSHKKKNADLVLTLNGYLRGTLNYRAGKESLAIGTPLIYGATHQFGRPEKNIPARPFLGLSADDTAMIQDAMVEWLRGDFT
ncbi:MAG: phage virion morphogenesis protein [Candidatus Competibacteraceae bacterium]